MDKEVIYTDSTSAADGRDGLAVAAQSTLAPASVHPPNVELAITPPVEPLPPGNALLKLSAPEQDGGERGAFPRHSAPARVRKTRSAGAPFIPPYVAEQRRSILHLLIRMDELAPNITLDDKGLVTLALKSLSFIQRSPTNKTLLFQELEKANYWYGGQGHHVTLVSQQDTAIRLWLTQLLFGGTLGCVP